jgi:hypothetical protein
MLAPLAENAGLDAARCVKADMAVAVAVGGALDC